MVYASYVQPLKVDRSSTKRYVVSRRQLGVRKAVRNSSFNPWGTFRVAVSVSMRAQTPPVNPPISPPIVLVTCPATFKGDQLTIFASRPLF